jgi:VanZ family protein
MRELQPMKSNGVTCAVKMPTLQNSTPWTGPAARFSHSGARILKNMSPKTRPVKRCLEKDGPQPDFKAGFRGLGSEIRFQVSGISLEKLHKFIIYWFPIIVYCLLIYSQSSHPSPQSLPDWPFIDKLLHFAGYALLGALFLRAFNTTPIKHHLKLVLILSVLLSALYGISDEIHQSFVPFRTADVLDALSDILGSIAGVYLYHTNISIRDA